MYNYSNYGRSSAPLWIFICVGLVFVLVISFASCNAVGNLSGESKKAANAAALKYAAELGFQNPRASCAGADSDGDGYVSCSIFADNLKEPYSAECAAAYTIMVDGCRAMKPQIKSGN